jgi:hypothetical protein
VTFSHYGDFGDVIYALAAVRDLCEEAGEQASLYLYPYHGSRELMTADRAEAILPLLRHQPYIKAAEWSRRPRGVRLDTALCKFAEPGFNIADRVSHYLNIPHSDRRRPWLTAGDPVRAAPVVFARGPRHRPPGFPWRQVVGRLGARAVFVGLPDEYEAFCAEVGPVPYRPTADLLDLARVVAGCDLFVGNQSAPRAVAEGLKRPVVVEQSDKLPDTHWHRPDAWYGSASDFWCPALDATYA